MEDEDEPVEAHEEEPAAETDSEKEEVPAEEPAEA